MLCVCLPLAQVIRLDNIQTANTNTAGSDWFATAVTRPDLVLDSFINIVHSGSTSSRLASDFACFGLIRLGLTLFVESGGMVVLYHMCFFSLPSNRAQPQKQLQVSGLCHLIWYPASFVVHSFIRSIVRKP